VVDEAGGGSLQFITTTAIQTVQPPFDAPNAVATIETGSASSVTPAGNGQFITKAADLNRGAGVAFKPPQLQSAPTGTLIAMFDIGFMTNTCPPAPIPCDSESLARGQKLLLNIINFLEPAAPPPQLIGNVLPNAGRPFGVAVHSGFAYVADPQSHTVWKFELANPTIKTPVAGIGWNSEIDPLERAGYNGDGIDALHAQLSNPSGVAVDSAGNLYIADRGNHAVRKISAGSNIIATVAGIPTSYAVGENTHPGCETGSIDMTQCVQATNLRLFGPRALAVDEDDNVYIVDEMNYQVKKLYADGGNLNGFIFVVAGIAGQPGSNDGPVVGPLVCPPPPTACRVAARLNAPAGVAVRGSTVYIADSGNNRILTVDDGEVAVLQVGSLSRPTGVAVGSGGTVYIADYGSHVIRRVTNCAGEGCEVDTIVGTGIAGPGGGQGTPGTSVQLNSPIAVSLDGGLLYIADMLNGRILSGNFAPPVITLH
jgi:sugar lactone lactonase YvrE